MTKKQSNPTAKKLEDQILSDLKYIASIFNLLAQQTKKIIKNKTK